MKYIEVKKDNAICWVFLNRPKNLNALNKPLLKELTLFNESLKEDTQIRVVIFSGKGKNFSSGSDIKEGSEKTSRLETWRNNYGKAAIKSILEINQITIAAINGYCLGGAACIASACDFRIASSDAQLGYPEINLGINLNWLGLPLALRLIGPARTKKLVIGGVIENATTLLNWGYYDEVHELEDLLEVTKQIALEYASKAPLAAQMIKRSVNELTYSGDDAIMHGLRSNSSDL